MAVPNYKKGNFVKVMIEDGQLAFVAARFMRPLGYRPTDAVIISQQRAVEKVKRQLQRTSRFGSKCRITKMSLEYENSGRTKPDGNIELVPVWRVNVESEKCAVRTYVPALRRQH